MVSLNYERKKTMRKKLGNIQTFVDIRHFEIRTMANGNSLDISQEQNCRESHRLFVCAAVNLQWNMRTHEFGYVLKRRACNALA